MPTAARIDLSAAIKDPRDVGTALACENSEIRSTTAVAIGTSTVTRWRVATFNGSSTTPPEQRDVSDALDLPKPA